VVEGRLEDHGVLAGPGRLVLGCWLIQRGHEELGTAICGGAIGGYKINRTLVKTSAIRHVSALLLVGLLALAPGCCAYTLDPQAVGPGMTLCLDRHDMYVERDDSLTQAQKDSAKLDSELVRAVLLQAGYPPAAQQAPEPAH
jgi:hypothetical protein